MEVWNACISSSSSPYLPAFPAGSVIGGNGRGNLRRDSRYSMRRGAVVRTPRRPMRRRRRRRHVRRGIGSNLHRGLYAGVRLQRRAIFQRLQTQGGESAAGPCWRVQEITLRRASASSVRKPAYNWPSPSSGRRTSCRAHPSPGRRPSPRSRVDHASPR